MSDSYEAVVIGTGFGGAISACRLSQRWPNRVLVLERGKQYPMGSFPRTPHDMARNFWVLPDERRRRPKNIPADELHGMFDIRTYKHMDVVLGAGLGGGSLIYANVFLEPPDEVFDERWPETCKKRHLMPYYRVAKEVLGSRPIPRNDDPRRRILRTELFEQAARELGRESRLLDINVFFGNDFNDPLQMGHQAKNRYGAVQTSCLYCAECDVGCNYHSKNTLDLNYLFVAKEHHGAAILTEHLAEKIAPLNEKGDDDPRADGSFGYHVYYRNLNGGSRTNVVRTNRVVLSAGTLGTTEFLLRCRDVQKTLPAISQKLGQSFSGNGDFLSFVMKTEGPADPNYGPVITQRTDFNLFNQFDAQRAFILEDASYPAFAAWFAEGAKPGFLHLGPLWRTFRHLFNRFVRGRSLGTIGETAKELLSDDLSYNSCVLLCMGLDRSDGVMSLDGNDEIVVAWPYGNSRSLYDSIIQAGQRFKEAVRAKVFFPLPTWQWPLRKNVTVHSLGGCVLADGPEAGVTSADRKTFGQVFGYKNLYVADGAIVPTAVGANPTATISALSEMVAEGITGTSPTADLTGRE